MRRKIFQAVFFSAIAVFLAGMVFVIEALYSVVAPLYTLTGLLLELFSPLLAVLVLALLLALLLATRLSRQITRPLESIDLQNPDERGVYEELRPLLGRITGQNRQLQQKVEELNREHQRQDSLRREFTANVSHELKTPLTSISGYAELMENGLVKPEDIPRFSGTIYHEAQRLIVLVNDIIRLSQLEDPDARDEFHPVDLYGLCRETIVSLSPTAEKRQVRFTLSGQRTPLPGVRRVLEEIIYNLCDNAVKYNRPGGTVAVSVTREGGFARLQVRDTGIGIPQDQLDRVFERFYRVDKSHSRELGGTGLGLSIVKHGAACHGGTVSVTSREGEGSTFTVLLPLPDGEKPENLT